MKFYNYDIISLIILIIGCLSLYFGNIRHCIGKFWLYCLCGLTAAYLILMISFSHANHFFSGDFYCSNSLLVFSLYIGYIILLPGFLYMFFASLCKQPVNHPVLVFLPCVLEFLLLLSNPVTHFYFYFTASGLYQMSLGVFILYLTNLIYCFLIFGFTLYHKKRLGNRIFTAFEILALFEIGVQVLQLFLRYTIFEGLAISIGLTYIMIIYYLADNPQNSLTGVYNRDAFYRAAAELIAQNPHEPYLLVRIDIYHFQDVNERFGYETGDLLIQKIADDLKQKLPYSCDIGYLGADDFVICMPEKDIPIFPTHMDLSCISPSVKRSHDIYFSVGVFHVNDRFMDISLMLDRAQFALNSIKNSYQTRIHVFTNEDEQKFQLENYMLHEMFHALNDHAFQIYIQPICDAASGKIVSGEVLVRWIDKTRGIISPAEFIPLFEKNGFITMLDPYVWKEAAAFLAERLQEHKTVCPLSVNISRADMALKNLPSIIHHILAEYSIPSSLFKLEITESAFDNNNEALFLTIDKLHQMGHLILMDDFGSGYSNLNTFKKMPVDILKADMGFMSDLDASEKGRIIVRNVVNITKELHMPIIVEGVETQIQYDYLKELHCEQIQGYYFSKPLPADEFARLLDMQETAIT